MALFLLNDFNVGNIPKFGMLISSFAIDANDGTFIRITRGALTRNMLPFRPVYGSNFFPPLGTRVYRRA